MDSSHVSCHGTFLQLAHSAVSSIHYSIRCPNLVNDLCRCSRAGDVVQQMEIDCAPHISHNSSSAMPRTKTDSCIWPNIRRLAYQRGKKMKKSGDEVPRI